MFGKESFLPSSLVKYSGYRHMGYSLDTIQTQRRKGTGAYSGGRYTQRRYQAGVAIPVPSFHVYAYKFTGA